MPYKPSAIQYIINWVGRATTGASAPDVNVASITAGDANIGNVDVASIAAGTTNIGDVDIASNTTVAVGELQGSATALQMPSVACKMVKFKALSSNVGNVYIGGAAVTKADGTTDTTTGLELIPGDESGWLPVTNLNLFYRICENAGDDLTYLALS